MTGFSALSSDIHAEARAVVVQTVGNIAAMKNVPILPEHHVMLATMAIEHMTFAELCQLAERERRGLAAAARAVNLQFDMVATARILSLIAQVEGKENLQDPLVAAIATKLVTEFEATLSDRQCVRWPEPMEMVRTYYARIPCAPIVKAQPDGGVCTTYWLNGKLHRDPKQGPAWHYVRGEEVRIEYGINGQLHREYADGPAVSYTHFEGREISGEEYFEQVAPSVIRRPGRYSSRSVRPPRSRNLRRTWPETPRSTAGSRVARGAAWIRAMGIRRSRKVPSR